MSNAPHQVEDLVALVTRLARALQKAVPSHELPDAAMEYLKREGLVGSPLRGTLATGGAAVTETCPNCECSMPQGCGGQFRRDGEQCWLNRSLDYPD